MFSALLYSYIAVWYDITIISEKETFTVPFSAVFLIVFGQTRAWTYMKMNFKIDGSGLEK